MWVAPSGRQLVRPGALYGRSSSVCERVLATNNRWIARSAEMDAFPYAFGFRIGDRAREQVYMTRP